MKSALLFISFLTLCHGVKLNNVTDVDVRLLQNIGKTILARSSTDPTIISLNIINLFIVLMLKGILYGAALINSQLPDQGPSGRNEVEYWLSDPEILLLLSYILLENEESTNMLQVACCHPRKTQQYLNMAKMVVKIRNVFVYGKPVETDYSKKFIEVQKAIDIGLGERTACASLCINM